MKCYLLRNERAVFLWRWSGEASEEVVEVRRRRGRGYGSEDSGWRAAARAPPSVIQPSERRRGGGAGGRGSVCGLCAHGEWLLVEDDATMAGAGRPEAARQAFRKTLIFSFVSLPIPSLICKQSCSENVRPSLDSL